MRRFLLARHDASPTKADADPDTLSSQRVLTQELVHPMREAPPRQFSRYDQSVHIDVGKVPALRAGPCLTLLARDGTGRPGEPPTFLHAHGIGGHVLQEFAARVTQHQDPHLYLATLAPEQARALDLTAYATAYLARLPHTLGRAVDALATIHHHTDPHVHVLIRGRDQEDALFHPPVNALREVLRLEARALATEQLGPRTMQQRRDALRRDVDRLAFTALDTWLQDRAHEHLPIGTRPRSDEAQFEHDVMAARLKTLQRLGLATEERPEHWHLVPHLKDALHQLHRREEIIQMLYHGRDPGPHVSVYNPLRPPERPLVGEVVARGLVSERDLRPHLFITTRTGTGHYVALDRDSASPPQRVRPGAQVSVVAASSRYTQQAIAGVIVLHTPHQQLLPQRLQPAHTPTPARGLTR